MKCRTYLLYNVEKVETSLVFEVKNFIYIGYGAEKKLQHTYNIILNTQSKIVFKKSRCNESI